MARESVDIQEVLRVDTDEIINSLAQENSVAKVRIMVLEQACKKAVEALNQVNESIAAEVKAAVDAGEDSEDDF